MARGNRSGRDGSPDTAAPAPASKAPCQACAGKDRPCSLECWTAAGYPADAYDAFLAKLEAKKTASSEVASDAATADIDEAAKAEEAATLAEMHADAVREQIEAVELSTLADPEAPMHMVSLVHHDDGNVTMTTEPGSGPPPGFVMCRVFHGSLQRDDQTYNVGDQVELPADLASRLSGVVVRVE